MMPPVTKTPYVPVSPVKLVCPQCGAATGKACKGSRGDRAEFHVERVLAAATYDVAARKELGKSTHYARAKERRLKNLLERISKREGSK